LKLVTTGTDVTTQYINASGEVPHNLLVLYSILRNLTKEGTSHKMLKTSIFVVLVAYAAFFLFTGKRNPRYVIT
jgi:hypothetical protein